MSLNKTLLALALGLALEAARQRDEEAKRKAEEGNTDETEVADE